MNYAVIVAGGNGSRMQSSIPKQFMLLNSLPVLMHTIRAFHQSSIETTILVVLHETLNSQWRNLCSIHHFNIPHVLIPGGNTRFHSVKNALHFITAQDPEIEAKTDSLIAIHDAARPLVGKDLITYAFQEALIHGSAVAAVPSSDTVRIRTHAEKTETVDRNKVYLIQTPQVFQATPLIHAYHQDYTEQFTDDASVIEKSGHPIHLIAGDVRNIKITFEEDIYLAACLLTNRLNKI